jgi:hypothetical protein
MLPGPARRALFHHIVAWPAQTAPPFLITRRSPTIGRTKRMRRTCTGRSRRWKRTRRSATSIAASPPSRTGTWRSGGDFWPKVGTPPSHSGQRREPGCSHCWAGRSDQGSSCRCCWPRKGARSAGTSTCTGRRREMWLAATKRSCWPGNRRIMRRRSAGCPGKQGSRGTAPGRADSFAMWSTGSTTGSRRTSGWWPAWSEPARLRPPSMRR